jgi:hypothetical protein
MSEHRGPASLCRAILWRVWLEQRGSILLFPALFCALLVMVVACAQFAPSLLTGFTRAALEKGAVAQLGVQPGGAGALSMSFLQLQAPFLLALFAGMSAASIAQRTIGSEADRGSLEILLATRYRISEIGVALLFASFVMAAASWAILVAGAALTSQLLASRLGFPLTMDASSAAAVIAMQLVLALLAAEVATIGTLLFPALARYRSGMSADPLQLLASLPALVIFIVANVRPDLGLASLSLWGLAVGALCLVAGILLLETWFRPSAFLET